MTYKNLLAILFFSFVSIVSFSGRELHNLIPKPLTNNDYNYIAINEILMWVANNGDGSHDPLTEANGFYWPGGKLAKKSAIFEDGLLWGGKVNGEIRVNGSTHRQGLQAGKILSTGIADNPENPRYRVYKIRKEWERYPEGNDRDAYERDVTEWPVEDGAPWVDVDDNGIYTPGTDQPDFIGDEVLWYVSNDLDTARTRFTYGSDPIGLEIQTMVWGYHKKNFLDNVVFKKYTLINKGSTAIDSMYLAYWTDDDLGDAHDDYVGCDTLRNLGYTYNADNKDGTGVGHSYGTPPPAVGHLLVQGPVVPAGPSDSAKYKGKWVSGYQNLPISSFILYIGSSSTYSDPDQGVYFGTLQFYNNMRSLIWNGSPLIDPNTGSAVKFALAGDPVAGNGWYEGAGWPGGAASGDRRFLLSSGPFTMAAGDTQEVTLAILIARGDDNLNSVTELKKASRYVQMAYDLNFKTAPEMVKPVLKTVPFDKRVTLYWDSGPEYYNEVDPFLSHSGLNDSTYTFEGYRIWQFRDREGTDPRVIATYDIKNDVDVIYDWQTVDGFPAYVVAIIGPNEGIRRSYSVTESNYDEKPLNNANPYYFAVTAYAYSAFSAPTYIESDPEIVEVFPGLQQIDEKNAYKDGDHIIADHIAGNGDGNVELIVIDPNALSGDEFQVVFEGKNKVNSYSFLNYTTNDTIIADCTDYKIDTVNALIIDGFIMKIENTGLDHIYHNRNYGIKSVVEVKGPGGEELNAPIDVFEQTNSTGEWVIRSYGILPDRIENINISDAVDYNTYEIRFTTSGSEYFLTGSNYSFFPWTRHDPRAMDRVPFEIWDVGKDSSSADDVRLYIKTLDTYTSLLDDSSRVDQDGKWSRLENGDWEPIFAYFRDSTYQEPLPDISPSTTGDHFKIGKIIISGELPEEGTLIRISTWKPLSAEDVFSVVATAPNNHDYETAKNRLDDISVFPNPFSGFGTLSGYIKQDFIRFTNLPTRCTVRIFSLAGIFVRRIDKNDDNSWLDWDLRNNAGKRVGSGIYIAHLEMPGIGEKIMKLAIVMENQR
jgi:hypothetical protein